MILSVTLNPSVDHALFVDRVHLGDTNRVLRTERDAGGKGVNLSRVVAELGADTMATGFVGGGPGDYVRSILRAQGVRECFIEVAEPTRINFSVEDTSLAPPTTFNERGPNIQPGDMDRLVEQIRELLPKVSWMTLGGSLPPGVPSDAFANLARLAHKAGAKVVVDADGEPMKMALAAGPDFVKPNAKELGRLLGREITTPEDAARGAQELHTTLRTHDCKEPLVIVSLGEHGAVMACSDGVFRGETPHVQVRSTIGSGDSLIAGVLWALDEGKPLEDALKWGMAAGAATATTNGSEIARRAVIHELLPQVRVERA